MIIVAGDALIDLILHADGRVTANAGGGPYNTARTIGRLGLPVAFLGGLSTDRFGQQLRDGLTEDHVLDTHAIATDQPTTLAVAELDGHGMATYRFYVAGTSASAVDRVSVAQALARIDGGQVAAIHVGTLGLVLEPLADAMEALVEGAPSQAIVMLDPNARPTATPDRAMYVARVDRLLARVDVIKASTDDLAYLRPTMRPADAVADLLGRGPRVVLWTDGAAPVRVVTSRGSAEIVPPAVTVVDTVGAGDALGGGFLAAWVGAGHGRAALDQDAALSAAARSAVRVAAFTCTRAGAQPPTSAELARWTIDA
jgi:fructokinase